MGFPTASAHLKTDLPKNLTFARLKIFIHNFQLLTLTALATLRVSSPVNPHLRPYSSEIWPLSIATTEVLKNLTFRILRVQNRNWGSGVHRAFPRHDCRFAPVFPHLSDQKALKSLLKKLTFEGKRVNFAGHCPVRLLAPEFPHLSRFGAAQPRAPTPTLMDERTSAPANSHLKHPNAQK